MMFRYHLESIKWECLGVGPRHQYFSKIPQAIPLCSPVWESTHHILPRDCSIYHLRRALWQLSFCFTICKVETLQVWQTRIYPLQAQGRRVLMPQNFELRALEGNLLLQSQLELGDRTPSWACCKTFIMFISTGFCATTNTNLQPQGSDAASHVHHHLWVNQLGVLHKIQWNHNGVGSLGCCQGNKGKRILEEDAVAWWKLGQFYFSPRPGNQPHPCFGNCPPVPSQQEAKCLLCSPFWAWGSKV